MTRRRQWEHAWGLRQCQQGAAEHPSGQGSLQAQTRHGTVGTTPEMLGEMLGVGPPLRSSQSAPFMAGCDVLPGQGWAVFVGHWAPSWSLGSRLGLSSQQSRFNMN